MGQRRGLYVMRSYSPAHRRNNYLRAMFFRAALQGKNEFWQYLVTILLVLFAIAILGYIPLMIVIGMKMAQGKLDQEDLESFMASIDFTALDVSNNVGVSLLLVSFAISLLVLWFCLRIFHERPLVSLVNGFNKVRWSKVFFAFGFWLAFSVVVEAVSYWMNPEIYTWQFNASAFIPLLIISLTLLPIQTSFEELLFRGYLMQGIGQLGAIILVPLLITSFGFGLMHLANPEVREFGLHIMMPYYMGSGLFLGIMTIMDDGLELALGTHAATNFFASTGVTFHAAALQTDALFSVSEINMEMALTGFVISSVLFLAICAWKYKWTNWNRFFQKPNLKRIAEGEIPTNIDNNI